MLNWVSIEDLEKIISNINEKDFDVVTKERDLDNHFSERFVLNRPKLKRTKNGFQPVYDIPVVQEVEIYKTLGMVGKETYGLRINWSLYQLNNYQNTDMPLRTRITNGISVFFESKSKLKGYKTIPSRRYDETDKPNIIESKKKNKILFSDLEWNKRFKLYRRVLTPFVLLYIYENKIELGPDIPNYEFEGDLNDLAGPIDHLSYMSHVKNVLRSIDSYIDKELIDFYFLRDIPIMRALIRKDKDGLFGKDELLYINVLHNRLKKIFFKHPTAETFWPLSMIFPYFYLDDNRFAQCQNCGNFIFYRNNKKYCSKVSEGQDCQKSKENKDRYKRYANKYRAHSRTEMRETRSFLRDKLSK